MYHVWDWTALYSKYVRDEQATIEDAYIEEVYDACFSWLTLKKAEVREQRRPEYLKAEHGYGRGVTYQDHAKFLLISLNQMENNVIINFKIPTLSWAPPSKLPVYPMFWSELVEDLWRHLGITIDEDFLKYLFPIKNLKKMYLIKITGFVFLTIIHGAGLLLGIILSWMEKTQVKSIIFFMFFSALSITGWIISARPMLIELGKIRHRKNLLYTDS